MLQTISYEEAQIIASNIKGFTSGAQHQYGSTLLFADDMFVSTYGTDQSFVKDTAYGVDLEEGEEAPLVWFDRTGYAVPSALNLALTRKYREQKEAEYTESRRKAVLEYFHRFDKERKQKESMS